MSKLTPSLLATVLALFAASCAAFPLQAAGDAPATRAENAFLSMGDAAARSARVSKVAYALDFRLTGEPVFKATTRVDFDLADTGAPLTLDLDKAKISALTVNGKPVEPQYNQWFITLPASALKVGRNSVSVSYQREHNTNGEGLHRYEDKADGRVYLYSHFEPAAAHQMFASFDQPDLKATFQLTATAPKDWHVISATRETKIEDLGATRRWTFPVSPVLSPYNFSMHAGPYRMWEDNSGKYPMRLFARQSVADQVLPEDWFRYTSKGLVYFDEYFGIPYPFKKYDQVIVPQFIYGAMENAAAVTFTENRFLSPVARTAARRESLASTILHEMAHQWFGDLVTMHWWNGLWLNESFASYMATLGMAASDEFKNTPLSFYRGKLGAYRTDESIATHPIEVPVASTANAFDNIDAITYNKGAAVLHQIRQQIGAETFRRGVNGYLASYSYRNATLDDFIGSLSKAAGRDLSPWARQWLYQPSVNTLQADFSCADGKLSRFEIRQSPSNAAFPTLREQRVQVGTFTFDGDAMTLAGKASVDYSGASTAVPALLGTACPDLVYPNYEDWGFAKVVLDPVSATTARTKLANVEDPLLRSMLWQSLSDGLSDRRLRLDDFIETVLANAPRETDESLLRQAMLYVQAGSNYLLTFAPGSAYEKRTSARIEDMLWTGLQSSRGNRDRSRTWLSSWIEVASTPATLAKLGDVLAGRLDAGGVEIDQELRWSIVEQLNRHDAPGSQALIAAELARDPSENGQLSALAAQIVRPDPAVKAAWLDKIQKNDGSEPFSRLRTAMRSLYPSGQDRFDEASAAQRLQTLPAIDKSADPVFMRSYGSMIPATCTAASIARLEAAMKSMDGLSAGTQRTLKSRHEADQRCLAIRQAFEAGGAIGASR